jgi:mannitol/fructose-specific phosphotransferase system IIA component (Ntr-type)
MKTINLKEKLHQGNVFLDVDVVDRFDVIRLIAGRLKDHEVVGDISQLAEDAINREEELSTGIDRGIAMPHARTNAVSDLICAFVRPANPVDFGSADGQPCDLIFFSAVPRKCVDQYLHFTAAIVRKLQRPEVLEGLRKANNAQETLTVLGI